MIIKIFYQLEISIVWVSEFKVECVFRNILHSDIINTIDLGSLKNTICVSPNYYVSINLKTCVILLQESILCLTNGILLSCDTTYNNYNNIDNSTTGDLLYH